MENINEIKQVNQKLRAEKHPWIEGAISKARKIRHGRYCRQEVDAERYEKMLRSIIDERDKKISTIPPTITKGPRERERKGL